MVRGEEWAQKRCMRHPGQPGWVFGVGFRYIWVAGGYWEFEG